MTLSNVKDFQVWMQIQVWMQSVLHRWSMAFKRPKTVPSPAEKNDAGGHSAEVTRAGWHKGNLALNRMHLNLLDAKNIAIYLKRGMALWTKFGILRTRSGDSLSERYTVPKISEAVHDGLPPGSMRPTFSFLAKLTLCIIRNTIPNVNLCETWWWWHRQHHASVCICRLE